MRLLLDTHVLIWWLENRPALPAQARAAIGDSSSAVYVSVATVWEIAIKQSIGKLRAPDDLEAQLERHRFQPLSITLPHAMAVATLPWHHRDPFDRLLIAQARAEGLTLVTSDARFARYEVALLAG